MNEQNKNELSLKYQITKSFQIFKNHLYEILFLSAIPFLAYTLLYIYAGDGSIEAILNIPMEIISIIYTLFFSMFLVSFPIIINITQSSLLGKSITLGDSFLAIRSKLFKLFIGIFMLFLLLIFIISFILVVLNFTSSSTVLMNIIIILFMSVAIKLFVDYIFYFHSIVLVNLNPIKALKYSSKITRRNWWRVFRAYFIFNICVFIATNIISLLIYTLIPLPILYNVLIAFVQSLVAMLLQIFLTVMFLSLDKKLEDLN
ncbi:hypothetical protein GC105_04835 [Alkalibaculum sp. M08DMB]|uniref:DUF7847 domain-containing protein n=1 Tax=Alkalibaculum sporogenes TaxID=2655001 RepID=A0A6A7K7M1_9FIRM|nr:hypothetical protein [Alkalibaculum sporogenes]MPW25113.1 hypothetical protein [Alkalibaculum sporogenes]